jgi:hypothetical protein
MQHNVVLAADYIALQHDITMVNISQSATFPIGHSQSASSEKSIGHTHLVNRPQLPSQSATSGKAIISDHK